MANPILEQALRAALVGAALVLAASRPAAADPDALWKIVDGQCVPDQQAHHDPAPCVSVDQAAGAAILKDRVGDTQYLLIPTTKITGIESPEILAPNAPNYFALAWSATTLIDQRLGKTLPRGDFALAINSERGRSQNQLHIHIDCIRPDIRATLDRLEPLIGPHWRALPTRLALHSYRARRIDAATLGTTNPFDLLAGSLSDPKTQMARHTLVLVGDTRHDHPDFILLDSQSAPFTLTLAATDLAHLKIGPGSGEELEDHTCRIASKHDPT